MNTQTQLIGFIRIINGKDYDNGNAIVAFVDEGKGVRLSIEVNSDFSLTRKFTNRNSRKALDKATRFAQSLPPRTTTQCLIAEYGLSFGNEEDPELTEALAHAGLLPDMIGV